MRIGHDGKGRLIDTLLAELTAASGTLATYTDRHVRRNSHHHIGAQPTRLHGQPPPATWQVH